MYQLQHRERIMQDLKPRVGRRVHSQRSGIGVITKVGEFYIEVNFKQKGVELLSLDDTQLEYLNEPFHAIKMLGSQT